MEEKIFYRRNLPHFQPQEAAYFITFRLANSLPKHIIEQLKKENEIEAKKIGMIKNNALKQNKLYHQQKRYFGKFDALLDGSKEGSLWLKDDRIAKIVSDAIIYRDKKKYNLIASCIMPNHVHMLFEISNNNLYMDKQNVTRSDASSPSSARIYNVTNILQDLKAYTAREANKILKKTGQFWQRESYDHVVRNEKEFENILNYIILNPVKAGLVSAWKDWKWTYCCYM